ncbi:MAG: CRTAC1 family protein [Albidovulum sp.]|nr:CRTAC1 family protein [Albidovulum sp.]
MRRCIALISLATVIAIQGTAEPAFTNLTGRISLDHTYDGGWEHFVGGGLALLDCDADGFPDLYVAGGANPAALFRNTTRQPESSLAFEASEDRELALTGVTGAYPLDIDGDGILDLFVLRVGGNAVFRGFGDCRFRRVEDSWGIDAGDAWTTAFSATWEQGEDWPTMAVGNYVDRGDPDGPFETCDLHQLLRPAERGYQPTEPIGPGYCALSMLFTDWSGSGRQDLWISNDRHYYVRDGREQLFRISPALREYSLKDGWQTQKLWGMGIASRDITGDALPEIAVTSMADQKLFTRDARAGSAAFRSIAYERGTTAHVPHFGDEGRPSTGWHVQFGDVDNDGLDDLFIAKGNVNQMADAAMRDPDNLLMQLPDGNFVEVGFVAGVASTERGRGGALADLNRDGLLDLVVVQRRAALVVYENESLETGNWLKVRLRQQSGNVNAVGAKIEIAADSLNKFREIQVGGGHAGGQAGYEHFGLGRRASVRLRVMWPDGATSEWIDLPAGRHYVIWRDGVRLKPVEEATGLE